MVRRAWIGIACLAATVAVSAAAPDSAAPDSAPAPGRVPQHAPAAENPDVPDSLLDLDVLLERLEATRSRLADPDRGVFDELLDAAREMAAGGDDEAARLLVADARRLLATPRRER